MDRNRLFVIGAVVVMVAIVALGWVLGIQPQLVAAASADQDRATAQTQNQASGAVLAKLKSDYAQLDTVKQQRDTLRAAIPADAEMPAFVDELDALAAQNHVVIKAITVSDAQPYAPPAPPVAAPAAKTSSTATPAPTDAPAPASVTTPVQTGAPVAVSDSRITAKNFSAIPVQVTVTGSYGDALNFVKGLQMGQRAFLQSSFSSTASTTGSGSVNASIGGFVYVVLASGAANAAG